MEKEQRFTGRQITTMVVAAAIAIVAAPVGAIAATGQLINITDPVTAGHKARVNAKGGLAVTARDPVSGVQARVTKAGAQLAATVAGVASQYLNVEATAYGNGRKALADTVNGQRLAVTQLTISYLGTGTATVDLWSWGILSSQTCATATAGSPLDVLRRVYVVGNSTLELTWNGPALLTAKPAAGKRTCFLASITGSTNRISFGVTGYTF
jgi:hypothetical protein